MRITEGSGNQTRSTWTVFMCKWSSILLPRHAACPVQWCSTTVGGEGGNRGYHTSLFQLHALYCVVVCSVLAVDYVARQSGVRRGMSGKEAVATCPQLHIFRVPEKRGKADLTRYREVGAKVIQVLSRYCRLVERASVDEAFLDLSEEVARLTHSQPSTAALTHTVVAGWEGDGGGMWTVLVLGGTN